MTQIILEINRKKEVWIFIKNNFSIKVFKSIVPSPSKGKLLFKVH